MNPAEAAWTTADPNFCPHCEYKHPVASMVTHHIQNHHDEEQ